MSPERLVINSRNSLVALRVQDRKSVAQSRGSM
jgi:hypothetical protein